LGGRGDFREKILEGGRFVKKALEAAGGGETNSVGNDLNESPKNQIHRLAGRGGAK